MNRMKKTGKRGVDSAGRAESPTLQKNLEKQVARLERDLAKRTAELEVCRGEITGIRVVSQLLREKDIFSIDEMLQSTVDSISRSLGGAGRAAARIMMDGVVFASRPFFESGHRQSTTISVFGRQKGIIEIFYGDRKKRHPSGDKHLIETIAELLERIFEQKKTEKYLSESEKRFRSLVEHSPTGIFIVQDGHIIYENPEEKRLSGPLARLFKQGYVGNIHPDDIEKVKSGYRDILSGETAILDMDFRYYQWSEDVTGQEGAAVEEDDDSEIKWVICRASMIEYMGKSAILVNKLDVTRAKELEHLLEIEDKMASLGRVAAGIAHEIRNPLSGINIYINNLEKILKTGVTPDTVPRILDQVRSASKRIESVIRRVMDFTKPGEPKKILTDLNRVIDESLDLSAMTLRRDGIELERSLDDGLPACNVDPHLMGQVLLNLVTNAAESMERLKGVKKIEVSSFLSEEGIVVKVADSGPGVPLSLRQRIFDPFYTTKRNSTGIGLSMSQRIVTDHGGTLVVETGKWGGAEFTITIPVRKRKKK